MLQLRRTMLQSGSTLVRDHVLIYYSSLREASVKSIEEHHFMQRDRVCKNVTVSRARAGSLDHIFVNEISMCTAEHTAWFYTDLCVHM